MIGIAHTQNASALGIRVANGNGSVVLNNRMTNAADYGIVVLNATGTYRDNITAGSTTPYTGGTDAGNNH